MYTSQTFCTKNYIKIHQVLYKKKTIKQNKTNKKLGLIRRTSCGFPRNTTEFRASPPSPLPNTQRWPWNKMTRFCQVSVLVGWLVCWAKCTGWPWNGKNHDQLATLTAVRAFFSFQINSVVRCFVMIRAKTEHSGFVRTFVKCKKKTFLANPEVFLMLNCNKNW